MIIKISSTIQLGLSLVLYWTMFSNLVIAQPTSSDNEATYPAKFSGEYLQQCKKEALSQGISSQEALKYCDCTLHKIQATYSFQDLEKMKTELENSSQISTGLNEIVTFCSKTIKD